MPEELMIWIRVIGGGLGVSGIGYLVRLILKHLPELVAMFSKNEWRRDQATTVLKLRRGRRR